MNAVRKGKTKSGFEIALMGQKDGSFGVWKLCENYCPHVRGGIKKTWRYIQKGMSEQDAVLLFSKKTKGGIQ